ncbi:MAG: hypothetical protein JXR49_14905 [Acidobacteria bacterium]|nr:hypothetical protein [Acidobacteriota bacterium]
MAKEGQNSINNSYTIQRGCLFGFIQRRLPQYGIRPFNGNPTLDAIVGNIEFETVMVGVPIIVFPMPESSKSGVLIAYNPVIFTIDFRHGPAFMTVEN